MDVRRILDLVRIVEAIDSQQYRAEGKDEPRKHKAKPSMIYQENFKIYGSTRLVMLYGPGLLKEFSLVTDSSSYELSMDRDGYLSSGSWDYWLKASTYTNTIDAFRDEEGYYVLRLQEIPFEHHVYIDVVSSRPLTARIMLAKVLPIEHG